MRSILNMVINRSIRDQFNLDVMENYVNLFNFHGCEIDIALR